MEKKEFGYVPPRFLVDRIARFRRWGKFKTRIDLEILRRRFDMETGKSKIKTGDVVKHKSPVGPIMVVNSKPDRNGNVECRWFEEENGFRSVWLNPDSLLVNELPAKEVTVYDLIFEERERIVEKWGVQEHSAAEWLVVLMEEVGEASQALLQGRIEDAKTELIQCAAVIVSMFDDLGWMVDETGA